MNTGIDEDHLAISTGVGCLGGTLDGVKTPGKKTKTVFWGSLHKDGLHRTAGKGERLIKKRQLPGPALRIGS